MRVTKSRRRASDPGATSAIVVEEGKRIRWVVAEVLPEASAVAAGILAGEKKGRWLEKERIRKGRGWECGCGRWHRVHSAECPVCGGKAEGKR